MAKATTIKVNLNEQAAQILEKAKARGVEHSYMFITTFARYQEHINHLKELEAAIKANTMMVEKEYVSYTHLDVYKRQPYTLRIRRGLRRQRSSPQRH